MAQIFKTEAIVRRAARSKKSGCVVVQSTELGKYIKKKVKVRIEI